MVLQTRGTGSSPRASCRYVGRVLFRTYQFILAATQKIQQVVQKFGYVRRADEVFQIQFAKPFAQVNPDIFVVEHAKLFFAADQQVVAVGVKSRDLQTRDVGPANLGANAFLHFPGGVIGICDSQNLIGSSMLLLNEPGNASCEHSGFARACPCDHQHRTAHMFDGLPLALVRLEGSRSRNGF